MIGFLTQLHYANYEGVLPETKQNKKINQNLIRLLDLTTTLQELYRRWKSTLSDTKIRRGSSTGLTIKFPPQIN